MRIKEITFIICTILAYGQSVMAQSQIVVCNATNKMPIQYANVYKAEKGEYKGTVTNEKGISTINFPFQKLCISHVSFKPQTLTTLTDTVFLVPKENILSEVVVCNTEPLWIRPFIKKFIKSKKDKYCTKTENFHYSYNTRNASNNSGYWFENSGIIRFPSSSTNNGFEIKPSKGYIHFKDSTAGCDFTNMKRMVYHDFVEELDMKFLKQHKFQVNDAFYTENRNVVQLYFKSTKYDKEDKGYIDVDTAKCVILSVIRDTGLNYNIDNNTNSFTRATINILTGWKYSKWIVNQKVVYSAINGVYYPSLCRYKAYILAESKKGKYTGTKFDSFESEIVFNPTDSQEATGFFRLFEPWYMKIIISKKERVAEQKLQMIPKIYIIY